LGSLKVLKHGLCILQKAEQNKTFALLGKALASLYISVQFMHAKKLSFTAEVTPMLSITARR
jgi:hypothetical protein